MDNRLRRYYRLTPNGSELLAAEAARLKANASAALSRLHLAGRRVSESAGLEDGYRRLLAWYPRSFRQEQEDEMLAVLMARASPASGGPAGWSDST